MQIYKKLKASYSPSLSLYLSLSLTHVYKKNRTHRVWHCVYWNGEQNFYFVYESWHIMNLPFIMTICDVHTAQAMHTNQYIYSIYIVCIAYVYIYILNWTIETRQQCHLPAIPKHSTTIRCIKYVYI